MAPKSSPKLNPFLAACPWNPPPPNNKGFAPSGLAGSDFVAYTLTSNLAPPHFKIASYAYACICRTTISLLFPTVMLSFERAYLHALSIPFIIVNSEWIRSINHRASGVSNYGPGSRDKDVTLSR